MGSFVDRSLPQAAAALIPAAIACALLAATRPARSTCWRSATTSPPRVGYRPRRLAVEVVALSAIAVGACVSVCGAIAFVGLIAPFAARR